MIRSLKKRCLGAFLFFFSVAQAQEISLGVKAGVDYSLNKEASEIVGSAGRFSPDSEIGFLGGIFGELKYRNYLLRPELFYNVSHGKFQFSDKAADYSVTKLSLPLLFGYNIYGSLDVYAGPAYQVILDSRLENIQKPLLNQVGNWASQIGLKWSLRRFELDLRYDFTFATMDNQLVDIPGVMSRAYFDDGRLNQFMLSLNYKIFDTTKRRVHSPGRGCYF